MNVLVTAFLSELVAIDFESAQKVKALGCPECRSVLHKSNFTRKFRGLEVEPPPQFEVRFSFCCSKDGCRNRLTPPSVRFMRHKVYLALVVVLAGSGIMTFLEEKLEVTIQTARRWQRAWSQILNPLNPLFLKLMAFLPAHLEVKQTPRPIVMFFQSQQQVEFSCQIQNALLFFQRFDAVYLRLP